MTEDRTECPMCGTIWSRYEEAHDALAARLATAERDRDKAQREARKWEREYGHVMRRIERSGGRL